MIIKKANASAIVRELIESADNKTEHQNLNDKHNKDAKYGWYRFDVRFSLPVCIW